MRKLRDEIVSGETRAKMALKKNQEKLKEKEKLVVAMKNELNELNDELGELNKKHRVNQYRISQCDRTLKYNLYDPNRSMVESHLNLSQIGSKSNKR